jgi:iron complex outermembrane receptor protein
MRDNHSSKVIILLNILALAGLAGKPALAQQSLPAIEVGAASPIKRQASSKPRASTTQAPSAPRPVSQQIPQAPDDVPEQATSAPDGALPIVADQYATVLVVTNPELRRTGGGQLGDILFSRPGVTGTETAPGAASRPVVRGLDNYRVRIQENGISTSGMSEIGEDHAVPIDPLGVSQLEVVRGPATLRWGSQAIGGVVNATNARIPETIPCPENASSYEKENGCSKIETRGAVSTVDAGMEGGALADMGAKNFALHGDIGGRRASNYAIPGYPYQYPPDPPPFVEGRQPNSSNRSGGGSIGGSIINENGYLGLAVTQYNSVYRIPGVEPAANNVRIDLGQTKVTGKGEIRPDSAYVEAIRLWAGVIDYKHNELANEGGFDGIQQTFTNKSQEGRVEIQLKPYQAPFAKITTAVGVQGAGLYMTAPGVEGGLFDPNRTVSVAGFAFSDFEFTPTTRAQIAGRIENTHITGSSPEFYSFAYPSCANEVVNEEGEAVCEAVNVSPTLYRNKNYLPKSAAIGLIQNLPQDLVVSLNAQYVERSPQAPELLSRGMHEATGTYDIGNPNLGIESAKQVELGFKRVVGPFRFEATAYYTSFGGFIYRNLTGETCEGAAGTCTPLGEGGDLNQAVYTQRDALFRGAEVQSQYDLAEVYNGVFGFENQFDVVRATFYGGGNVPRIPPVRLGGGLFYRDTNWVARINLLHAFSQNNIAYYETPTAGYNLLKAEVSYKTKLDPQGRRELMMGITGNNLLNQNIRNSVSFRKDQILLPGANLRLFANITF